jgi:hypothetical protein
VVAAISNNPPSPNTINSNVQQLSYSDPEGKYTLKYPSDWSVIKKQNRFEPIDLSLVGPSGLATGYFTIQVTRFPPYLAESAKAAENSDEFLKIVFPEILKGYEDTLPGFTYVEAPLYDKYSVDGHKAASQVFTSSLGDEAGIKFAGLLVWTVVNQQTMAITFGADRSNFDLVLPMAEKIIDSIDIVGHQQNKSPKPF